MKKLLLILTMFAFTSCTMNYSKDPSKDNTVLDISCSCGDPDSVTVYIRDRAEPHGYHTIKAKKGEYKKDQVITEDTTEPAVIPEE